MRWGKEEGKGKRESGVKETGGRGKASVLASMGEEEQINGQL